MWRAPRLHRNGPSSGYNFTIYIFPTISQQDSTSYLGFLTLTKYEKK